MIQLPFIEAADRVKQSIDIIDIVQRHVVLKKSGRNYTGLCPFHQDKNPSMSVSREKNLFKCFSCGEGGDALTFMMKIENQTYGEVIRELARDQGIDILFEGQNKEQVAQRKTREENIYALNTTASDWFHRNLINGALAEASIARTYLKNRNIAPDVVERFQLGFALPGWDNLNTHLRLQHAFTAEDENKDILVVAGLASPRQDGSGEFDKFRNRLIVPIHNDRGDPVGFGGRSLSDEDQPKYLNSPETPVYIKNRILYGMHLAKQAIREKKRVLIMEGYFDVISAHVAGFTEAVGVCGTAFTENHLKLVTRFGADTIYLAFDADAAGQKATLSAIEMVEPVLAMKPELALRIIHIPEGKDPDDFLTQHGADAFETLMNQAIDPISFKLHYALKGIPIDTSEGRVKAAFAITPVLADIRSPIQRDEFIRIMAGRIGSREETLGLEVRRYLENKNGGAHSGQYVPEGFSSGYKSLQKNGQKKAIYNQGSHSLKKKQFSATSQSNPSGRYSKSYTPSQPSDNMHEMRRQLTPKHLLAERNLLRLMLLNIDNYRMIGALQVDMFTEPVYQQIFDGLTQLLPSLSSDTASIGDVIQHVIGQYSDTTEPLLPETSQAQSKPPASASKASAQQFRYTLAELALTTDELDEELGLANLSPAQYRTTVDALAHQYLQIIQEHQQKQQLTQLNQKLKQTGSHNEYPNANATSVDSVEVQYEIRERLMKRFAKPATPSPTADSDPS